MRIFRRRDRRKTDNVVRLLLALRELAAENR
jgi:hypothetical protein